MRPPDPLRELALDFLAKAQGDVEFALAGVDRARAPGWGIAFHCQQAVEKAIKGALSLNDVTPPKTHDLERLGDLASSAGLAVPLNHAELRALTQFAVDDRYPRLTLSDVSRETAIAFLPSATGAVEWLAGLVRVDGDAG